MFQSKLHIFRPIKQTALEYHPSQRWNIATVSGSCLKLFTCRKYSFGTFIVEFLQVLRFF